MPTDRDGWSNVTCSKVIMSLPASALQVNFYIPTTGIPLLWKYNKSKSEVFPGNLPE